MVLFIPALARANPPATTQSPVAGATSSAPPTDSLRKSQALLAGMHDRLQRVQNLRDAAHKQRGALPESCVTARITEVKTVIEIAGESMTALEEALHQRNDEERVYQLTRLNLLAEKAQKAEEASRTCVDEERSTIQTTQVKIETEAAIPQEDLTQPPLLPR